jgi:hypothetical protein
MSVNLSPLGGAGAQFFSNNGVPLAGGLLYTYLAGTSTPATAYTSSSGITALANPIVLDSAGRVPTGEIWLTDGISYKFVLNSATDVLIATWDNLSGINSNFIAYTAQQETATATAGQTVFTTTLTYVPATNNLAVFVNGSKQIAGTNYTETGSNTVTFLTGLNVGDLVQFSTASPVSSAVVTSNNVGYMPAGTGAVATNVQSKLRETVSVKDFGAVGDGVTNDTAAIQAAINAGNYVLFPTGTYNVSTQIALHSNSHIDLGGSTINWVGAVVNNSNKSNKADNCVFYSNYSLAPPSPIKYNVSITNGTINVNDWGCAINCKQTYGFYIADLIINTAQCAGINITDSDPGSIERCTLNDCAANPASGFNPATDLEAWSDGIAVWYGSSNVTVKDCSVINTRVGTGRAAIFMERPSTESLRNSTNISAIDCTFQGYDRQFHVELAYNISAINCTFNFVTSGTKTFNSAVVVWDSTDVTFVGCKINTVNIGVSHTRALRNTFVGCNISSTAASSGTELFRAIDSPTTSFSNFSFTDCYINANLAALVVSYMDAKFEACTLQTNAYSLNNIYEGNFIFTDCLFNKAGVRTALGTSTNTYDFTNCTWTGFTSVQNPIASTVGVRRVTLTNCEFNGGQVYCESPLEIIGKTVYDYNLYTVASLKGPIVNGNWYKNATPTTGSWLAGNRIYRYTPTVGQPKSWVCTSSTDVTTGTINSGSNSLAVASGVGINNGDSITVAGAGAAGAALVTTVSSGGGTGTLILGTNAGTSVVSAAVTTTGTWVSEGNL